jgi:hypothetical protein
MKTLKTIISIALATAICSSFSYAKKPEEQQYYNDNSHEYEKSKQKDLPKGLQKRVENGKGLPEGWQKKLIVGQRFDPLLLGNAVLVTNPKYYSKNGELTTKEAVYQIENKIVKVMRATNIIMDVLDVE